MPLNFPSPPYLNQTYYDSNSGVTYLWDGSAWLGATPGGVLVAEQVWANNNNNGIYTSRKVGINTNNPLYQLDVFGSSRIVGLLTCNSLEVNTNVNITGVATVGGSLNPKEIRIKSAGEKITRATGNIVTINYKEGYGNIGYCTSPTGDITLEVIGIPTDASFDNHLLNFSVIVQQTGIARTCNRVKLNGVISSIKWPEGLVGLGNTYCHDIFNFTGINTVGTASTTKNYLVLGLVNGDFR